MIFSFRTYILMLCASLPFAISACAGQIPASSSATTFPPVTLPGTEVRTLKSSNTGRNYDLYIRFPAEYAQHPTEKYPVLYVLDGQWDLKLLDSIYGGLFYDGFVPEMIIVGVTYSGDNPDYESLRAIDYTLTAGPSPSGDAPKFLAFLKEELIPFIEENYRVESSERMLMGHSFGGLFTLYALFTEPELFNGYVAASPAVSYGERVAFELEAEYAGGHPDLPVRLFLSVGDEEPLFRPVKEFMQIMSEREYEGLQMETRVIEGERHAGNKPEAFNRGLRFIFQDD